MKRFFRCILESVSQRFLAVVTTFRRPLVVAGRRGMRRPPGPHPICVEPKALSSGNRIMKVFVSLTLALFVGVLSAPEAKGAKTRSDSYYGYEAIVDELSRTEQQHRQSSRVHPLSTVWIHGGVGFVTTYLTLAPPELKGANGFLKGFEASFGIDLLSRHWIAEGAVRSFGKNRLSENSEAALREFDLRIVYKNALNRLLHLRTGGGLAARYLDFHRGIGEEGQLQEFTTPSSIFSIGIEAPLTDTLTFATGLAYRSSLISNTIDRSSFDATLRVDAHF